MRLPELRQRMEDSLDSLPHAREHEKGTKMAELDMSWTTEYQVVEDPYKGEDERDFEHFDI